LRENGGSSACSGQLRNDQRQGGGEKSPYHQIIDDAADHVSVDLFEP